MGVSRVWASGFVREPVDQEQMGEVLSLVGSGGWVHCPDLDQTKRLTECERQVLKLLLLFLEDKEIAEYLELRPKTVSNCVSNILLKMEAKNRTQAVLIYYGLPLKLGL